MRPNLPLSRRILTVSEFCPTKAFMKTSYHHGDLRAALLAVDTTPPVIDGTPAEPPPRIANPPTRALGAGPAPIVFFSSRDGDAEIQAAVADCFPARYVQKNDQEGPAAVALEGARLMRKLVDVAGAS